MEAEFAKVCSANSRDFVVGGPAGAKGSLPHQSLRETTRKYPRYRPQKMADFENRRIDVEISDIDTELSLEAQLADADTAIDASLELIKTKLSELYHKSNSKDEEDTE